MLQVKRHTEFIPQPIEGGHRNVVRSLPSELHAAKPKVRGIIPGRIAADGILDLDDPRPEAGKKESRDRSRQGHREIENRKVLEGRFFRRGVVHDAAADWHMPSGGVNQDGNLGPIPHPHFPVSVHSRRVKVLYFGSVDLVGVGAKLFGSADFKGPAEKPIRRSPMAESGWQQSRIGRDLKTRSGKLLPSHSKHGRLEIRPVEEG
jgi:hypothetical protein